MGRRSQLKKVGQLNILELPRGERWSEGCLGASAEEEERRRQIVRAASSRSKSGQVLVGRARSAGLTCRSGSGGEEGVEDGGGVCC